MDRLGTRELDRLGTRERIIDGTRAILLEKGFANATTKEIAAAAGVAEGSLYRNFADKFDLFIATFVEGHLPMAEVIAEVIEELKESSLDLQSKLVRLAKLAVGHYAEVIPIVGAITSDPELMKRYQRVARGQRGLAPSLEILAQYLVWEQKRGVISAFADVETASAQLLGTCFFQAWSQLYLGAGLFDQTPRQFTTKLGKSLATLLGDRPEPTPALGTKRKSTAKP